MVDYNPINLSKREDGELFHPMRGLSKGVSFYLSLPMLFWVTWGNGAPYIGDRQISPKVRDL